MAPAWLLGVSGGSYHNRTAVLQTQAPKVPAISTVKVFVPVQLNWRLGRWRPWERLADHHNPFAKALGGCNARWRAPSRHGKRWAALIFLRSSRVPQSRSTHPVG